MSSNSNEIRKYMALCENAEASVQSLEEGPMLNRLMGAMGNRRAQGRSQRDDFAKQMKDQFSVWIGRTNRKGTIDDVEQFLVGFGFTQPQVSQILGQVTPSGIQQPDAPGTTAVPSGDATAQSTPPSEPEPQAAGGSVAPAASATSTTPSSTATPAASAASATPAASSVPAPTASRAVPPASSDSRSTPELKAAQQKHSDAMNYHDNARQQAFSDYAKQRNPNERGRLRTIGNQHRDEYNKHQADHSQVSDELNKRASAPRADATQKLSASLKYSDIALNEVNLQHVALRGSEINNIFTIAAAYAHDNNLARKSPSSSSNAGGYHPNSGGFGGYRNNTQSNYSGYSGANDGGYGDGGQRFGTGNPSSGFGGYGSQVGSNSRQASSQTGAMAQKVMDFAIKEGLTQRQIQEVRAAVQSARNSSKIDEQDKNALMVLGFAFLKVL